MFTVDVKQQYNYNYNSVFLSVVKTKIQKAISYISGDRLLILRGKRTVLRNVSPEPFQAIEPVILADSQCGCEVSPSTGETMVIMGIKQTTGYKYVVTYMSRIRKEKDFKRAMRTISKNFTCSKSALENILHHM